MSSEQAEWPDPPPFKDRLQMLVGPRSVNSFAKLCGLPESTLRSYLSGRSKPGLEHAQKVADACGVDRYWLVTGMGSPRRQDLGTGEPSPAGDLSLAELGLIKGWRQLDAKGRQAVLAMMEALTQAATEQVFNGPVENIAGRDVKHVTTGDVKQGKGGRIG